MSCGLGVWISPLRAMKKLVPVPSVIKPRSSVRRALAPFSMRCSLEVGNLVVDAAAIFGFGVNVSGGYGLLGRDDKVSALFVIVRTASDVAHERDDVDGDDGTGTFCDEGVVKAQGTPGDVVHDLKVQIFQGGQIFFYGFVRGVFHLVDVKAAVDFGVFHGGVQAF